jgi:hypothetical protein
VSIFMSITIMPDSYLNVRRQLQEKIVFNKGILDNRAVRHTFGRIDAVFRTAAIGLVTAIQLGKTTIKTAVCIVTLGQLDRFESTKTFGFSGVARDMETCAALAYKTAVAARDILVAPKKDYAAMPVSVIRGLEIVLKGEYHYDMHPSGDYKKDLSGNMIRTPLGKIIGSALKADPFLAVTDKQIDEEKTKRQYGVR